MSLDVHLLGPKREFENTCYACGHTHIEEEHEHLFWSNITHNLGKMAEAAGIYVHLWRPEELNITKAAQLIEPLEEGLKDLKDRPMFFKRLDAQNGWGTYEQFVPWVAAYLEACKQYPDATISVSR